jgi:hypothetical protein
MTEPSPTSTGLSSTTTVGANASPGDQPGGINDELVMLIADRVYRRLLQELQYEHERLRMTSKRSLASRFRKGGR